MKALTAFPTVLAQMDKNIQWTTDLGNAYYNQPQDVMDSVQAMRQKAQGAGQLRNTPQQVVTNDGGAIRLRRPTRQWFMFRCITPGRFTALRSRRSPATTITRLQESSSAD